MSKKKGKPDDIPTGSGIGSHAAHPPLRTDPVISAVPLLIEVTRVTISEIGSSLGNVQIQANGFSFSIGIMEESKTGSGWWCAWPSRRGRTGRSYPLLWAVDNDLRYAIEQEALAAFKAKLFAPLYADFKKRFGLETE